jgi:hypothetical protein
MSLEPLPVVDRPLSEQPNQSLSEAFQERRGLDVEDRAAPEKAEDKETVSLAEMEDIRRLEGEVADDVRRARKAGRAHASLSDALEGVSRDSELEQELEQEAAAELEAEQADDEAQEDDEDPETEPAPEDEEQSEDDAEQDKPEDAKPLPLPKSLAELNPEQAKQLSDHVAALYERAEQTSQPIMKDVMVDSLARAMQTPAEHIPELAAVVDILNYGGRALVEAAVPQMVGSYFQDFVQNHLPQVLENLYPGMQASYAQAQAGNVWSDVCAAEEFKSLDLPAFGTPEFQAVADKLYAANPWLNDFDPLGPDGKQLPVAQALKAKAEVCARLLAGARVDPKAELKRIAEAVQTTKQAVDSRNRRVSASRSLGAGRTAGVIGEEERATSLFDAYNSNHSRGGI